MKGVRVQWLACPSAHRAPTAGRAGGGRIPLSRIPPCQLLTRLAAPLAFVGLSLAELPAHAHVRLVPPAPAQPSTCFASSAEAASLALSKISENPSFLAELPFGEEWCPRPPAGVCGSVTAGQPKRFTGKERDKDTVLDYFGARYYGLRIKDR